MIEYSELIKSETKEELQCILSNLSGSENRFEDNVWVFERSSKPVINFNYLNNLSIYQNQWLNNSNIGIIELAKSLFLYANQKRITTSAYKQSFDTICKTFWFLSTRNLPVLNRENLSEYFTFILMHDLENGQLIRRITPLHYHTFFKSLEIDTWINTIKKSNYCVSIFSSNFSQRIIEDELKKTISSISADELTLEDWKDGGNLDRLTLDYGRYYIEHCYNFFHENISLAIALQKTIGQVKLISNNANLFPNDKTLKTAITGIITNYLSGKSVDELPENYSVKYSTKTLKDLHKETLRMLLSNWHPLLIKQKMLGDIEIQHIMVQLNQDHTNEFEKDWIKRYVSAILDVRNHKDRGSSFLTSESIINKLKHTSHGLKTNLGKLDCIINDSFLRLSKATDPLPPDLDFYKLRGMVLSNSRGSTYPREFISKVAHAGTNLFVALTGWRASEYAFSLKDIHIYRNDDILDQLANPLRYEVKWFVPKTNGQTKLCREITDHALQCTLLMSELVLSNNNSPCIYLVKHSSKMSKDSTFQINRSSASLWCHFVKYYKPFTKLDSLSKLNELENLFHNGKLDSNQKDHFEKLLHQCDHENWHELKNDFLLNAAHLRANKEFTRVEFLLKDDKRKNYVWQYTQKTLNTVDTMILDQYLSDDTKNFLKLITKSSDINPRLTEQITNEIMEGCLYPTPHAFRHMWAEAVYRRFDGDVGWMIRSNFKHISPRMWLAYIRNKDNIGLHQQVKRKVISSLLLNHSLNTHTNYAGAIDTFLRRIFSKTKTASFDQLSADMDLFAANEIIDIKSSPWGYCLLKTRNQSRAKCAVNGIPQRQNAAPKFCFGCPNNLSQETHIDGILLHISNDIKVLNTPGVPGGFVRESFTTVKNALAQLTKLKADKNILVTLTQALDAHKNRKLV